MVLRGNGTVHPSCLKWVIRDVLVDPKDFQSSPQKQTLRLAPSPSQKCRTCRVNKALLLQPSAQGQGHFEWLRKAILFARGWPQSFGVLSSMPGLPALVIPHAPAVGPLIRKGESPSRLRRGPPQLTQRVSLSYLKARTIRTIRYSAEQFGQRNFLLSVPSGCRGIELMGKPDRINRNAQFRSPILPFLFRKFTLAPLERIEFALRLSEKYVARCLRRFNASNHIRPHHCPKPSLPN